MGSKIPKENMQPLGRPGNEEHDAEVRKGLLGSASPKRKISQQIRRMKENPNKIPEDIFELITNPEASAAQIQTMIQEASKMDLKPGEFIQLINTVVKKHTSLFGDKVILDGELKINTVTDAMMERLKIFKDGEQDD